MDSLNPAFPKASYSQDNPKLTASRSITPIAPKLKDMLDIIGNDIYNLNGLNVLTYIGNELCIDGNSTLINLTGLDNITSIGKLLY